MKHFMITFDKNGNATRLFSVNPGFVPELSHGENYIELKKFKQGIYKVEASSFCNSGHYDWAFSESSLPFDVSNDTDCNDDACWIGIALVISSEDVKINLKGEVSLREFHGSIRKIFQVLKRVRTVEFDWYDI